MAQCRYPCKFVYSASGGMMIGDAVRMSVSSWNIILANSYIREAGILAEYEQVTISKEIFGSDMFLILVCVFIESGQHFKSK